MIGVPGMAPSRRVVKVEKPRPLKLSNLGDHSMETVLTEMDLVSQKIHGGTFDRSTQSQIASLCENLKMFGPQLESIYKDQLDRCYVSLRNGCRDDRLMLASRYRLLEVIELRAMNWQPNENLTHYYKQKLAQIEMEESCQDEPHINPNTGFVPTGAILTPTAPNSAPVYSGQYPTFPSQAIAFGSQQQQQQHQQQPPSHVIPGTPLVLAPGEIMKCSGKYPAPVRVPGKNHCKDEIVIRNADSGKVMGLKGRRVHMIEELSETVISFQRVAPGARERLVQITGTGEDNITQAKQLIEDTIRRNASPIRSDERNSLMTHAGSCSSISSHTSDETLQGSKRASVVAPSMEDAVGDYRYTVTHEHDTIRITGSNLELVRTAKLVLDEYFCGEKNLNGVSTLVPVHEENSSSEGSGKLSTPEKSIEDCQSPVPEGGSEAAKGTVVTVVRQPLIPSSSKEAIESAESNSTQDQSKNIQNRRMQFAKTSEEKKVHASIEEGTSLPASPAAVSSVLPSSTPRIIYTREFLLRCAASTLSRQVPANWTQVTRLVPSIIKKETDFVEPNEVLQKELRWSGLRTLSVTDDDDYGNSKLERSRSFTE